MYVAFEFVDNGKDQLYAYRVLGAYGSGSTSGIIAAIEHSVDEQMDVINLSLGGGANSETDAGSFAINNAMMADVISVIATGNSGPNRGTMGTPATARLGIKPLWRILTVPIIPVLTSIPQ